MAKNLVIVESPAKAKTIEKFLGNEFEVRASMGHIIDLPRNGLGVDTRKDFAPKYVVIEKKGHLLKELKAASKKAQTVYLAPDPDREGEFIAWSLKHMLGLRQPRRAVFNEITKRAVQDAVAHPREIDENLFNAQQARRVLDRLGGHKVSPWRCGRVSASVRKRKPPRFWPSCRARATWCCMSSRRTCAVSRISPTRRAPCSRTRPCGCASSPSAP